MRINAESNLDKSGGTSHIRPLNHAVSFQMMQEVQSSRNTMRIVVQEPQTEELREKFLEISNLFDALYTVTDYSFYDHSRLAETHL